MAARPQQRHHHTEGGREPRSLAADAVSRGERAHALPRPSGERLESLARFVAKGLFFAVIFCCLAGGRLFAGTRESSGTVAPVAVGPDTSGTGQGLHKEGAAEAEEHRLPRGAVEIVRPFGFPVTNSMVLSWAVALGLIVFAQIATHRMKLVPEGDQNFLEWLVEGLHGLLAGIMGHRLADRTYWFFATVFIFILAANWAGLVPGVGTIGWGHRTQHGFRIEQPLLRGANADLNLTLAMAMVFFAAWLVWALQETGPMGVLRELFAPKGETAGAMRVLMVVVFFAAGCLEVISILFRPVSLSFRLYGNIFAGETMLETMAGLMPALAWLLPIPFYFMELLVGLIQALVFMLLTAVFTLLICQHEEEAPRPRTVETTELALSGLPGRRAPIDNERTGR
jgi:F-type H+-transporting ATPase subunit a